MMDMKLKDLEKVLYFESFIVTEPGLTSLKKGQIISEEEYDRYLDEFGDERCAELLETIPNFDDIFDRKTTEEVQSILDQFLSSGEGNAEVQKYGTSTETGSSNSVEAAFNDLLNS